MREHFRQMVEEAKWIRHCESNAGRAICIYDLDKEDTRNSRVRWRHTFEKLWDHAKKRNLAYTHAPKPRKSTKKVARKLK